jgi:hypothetical protein
VEVGAGAAPGGTLVGGYSEARLLSERGGSGVIESISSFRLTPPPLTSASPLSDTSLLPALLLPTACSLFGVLAFVLALPLLRLPALFGLS